MTLNCRTIIFICTCLLGIHNFNHAQEDRQGSFIAGGSIYPIEGTVSLSTEGQVTTVNFGNDFKTVQGIRLEVFLSTDSDYDATQDLKISEAPLDQGSAMNTPISGAMSFTVPAEANADDYSFVVVQCTSASVLWGYAELMGSEGGGNSNNNSQNTWLITEVDEGQKPTIAIDNNGNPQIAIISESTTSGFIKRAQLVDGTFKSDLVSEGYFYGPIDLAFTPDNKARIGYHDHDTEEYALARELDGGTWDVDQVPSEGHDGWDNTIFIESNGTEHLLSSDPGTGLEYAIKQNGVWNVELIDLDITTYRYATDIEVVNGVVYAVGYSSNLDELYLATRENGTWETEVITASGRYPSLAVDQSGDIKVAFFKKISDQTGAIQVGHRGSVGWEFITIDTLKNYSQGSARNVVDLERTSFGEYLAYSDKSELKVAKANGNSWDIETVLEPANPELRGQTSMALDNSGYMHFAIYRDQQGSTSDMVLHITNKPAEMMVDTMMVDTMMMDTMMVDTSNVNQPQNIVRSLDFDIEDSKGNNLSGAELVATSVNGNSTISKTSNFGYAITTLENVQDEIEVCVSYLTPASQGVSVTDVRKAQLIILGLIDPCPEDMIAADVNESNSVTATDLVQMLNVIIGNSAAFTKNPSWVFTRNGERKNCETYSLDNLPSTDVKFIGIKKGNLECEDSTNFTLDNDPIKWKH